MKLISTFIVVLLSIILISCSKKSANENNSSDQKQQTTEQKKPAGEQNQDIQKSVDTVKIDLSKHKDFKMFWSDFKKCVQAKSIDNIVKMTNFPFRDFSNAPEGEGKLLSKSADDLKKNYDKIFMKSVVDLCAKELPMNGLKLSAEDKEVWGDNPFTESERKFKAEYFFVNEIDYANSLEFGKADGVYKLIGLKYLP